MPADVQWFKHLNSNKTSEQVAPSRPVSPLEAAKLFVVWAVISVIGIVGSMFLYEIPFFSGSAQTQIRRLLVVAGAAFAVGAIAWFFREKRRVLVYPVIEVAFGTVLSVQGVILNTQQTSAGYLPALLAFIGGVRIIADGFKRLDEIIQIQRSG
jgi:hypothetical protein